MNQNEILKANLLDIVFDNRNKNYGAYVLRKFYPGRLTKSLIVSLSLVLFLFLVTLFANKSNSGSGGNSNKGTIVVLTDVKPPTPVEPVKPKPIVQSRATVPFT